MFSSTCPGKVPYSKATSLTSFTYFPEWIASTQPEATALWDNPQSRDTRVRSLAEGLWWILPTWLWELLLSHPTRLVGGSLPTAKLPQGNTLVPAGTSASCPELPPATGSTTHTVPPWRGHLSWGHPVP